MRNCCSPWPARWSSASLQAPWGRADSLRCRLQGGKDKHSFEAQSCGDCFPWLLRLEQQGPHIARVGSPGLSHTAHFVSPGAEALAMLVLLLCIPDLAPQGTVSVASNLCLLFTIAISFPSLRSGPRQSSLTSPFSLPSRATHNNTKLHINLRVWVFFTPFSDLDHCSDSH